ncbi:hypothetical protein P7K49_004422, partial [Saguinus oedipus]
MQWAARAWSPAFTVASLISTVGRVLHWARLGGEGGGLTWQCSTDPSLSLHPEERSDLRQLEATQLGDREATVRQSPESPAAETAV